MNMNQFVQVKETLQSHSLRITKPRLAVASILIKNNALLTPEEIHTQIKALSIISLPILLIMLQPDAGSAIVFASLFFERFANVSNTALVL